MIAKALEITGFYAEKDLLLFEEKVKIRNVSRNEILLRKGEVCRSIFFNLSGAFYQYRVTDDMEQQVIDLHADQEWFLNHRSFAGQKPSESYMEAYTESSILELTVESLHHLIAQSPSFLQMGKILDQATSRVHFFDNDLTPTQKYQYILDNRPELIHKFPLKIIASYLKITPETLSRVRNKFSGGNAVS